MLLLGFAAATMAELFVELGLTVRVAVHPCMKNHSRDQYEQVCVYVCVLGRSQ
jgi:hypothetical protein